MTVSESHDIEQDPAARVHRIVAIIMVVVLTLELGVAIWEAQWLAAVLIATIAALILGPAVLGDRLSVKIPYEFQLATQLFVFAALFFLARCGAITSDFGGGISSCIPHRACCSASLGSCSYTCSTKAGASIFGCGQRFVALFAFLFAVASGAVWEIFEFTMDRTFGTQMQKPMLGDSSGLTDTMWDLIVDTLGALLVSLMGWHHMRRKKPSFIDVWIKKFIARNPAMFR